MLLSSYAKHKPGYTSKLRLTSARFGYFGYSAYSVGFLSLIFSVLRFSSSVTQFDSSVWFLSVYASILASSTLHANWSSEDAQNSINSYISSLNRFNLHSTARCLSSRLRKSRSFSQLTKLFLRVQRLKSRLSRFQLIDSSFRPTVDNPLIPNSSSVRLSSFVIFNFKHVLDLFINSEKVSNFRFRRMHLLAAAIVFPTNRLAGSVEFGSPY